MERLPSAPGLRRAHTSTLTGKVLRILGALLALVTLLLTALSYQHVTGALERQSIAALHAHVEARAALEGTLFALAEDNHTLIRAHFLNNLHNLGDKDPKEEFESRFEQSPSRIWHSKALGFDPARDVASFFEPNSRFDADFRRRIIATEDTVKALGPAFMTRFHNTWMSSVENASVAYWPSEKPRWLDMLPQGVVPSDENFLSAAPARNPDRKSVWTKPYVDQRSQQSMVSVLTPVYDAQRFMGIIGHDVLLEALVRRTTEETLEGTYNVILRDDGYLIAHPSLTEEIHSMGGTFLAQNGNDPVLREIVEQTKSIADDVFVRTTGEVYMGIARIPGPRWLFITVEPRILVEQAASRTARFILLGGVALLLIELLLVSIILRRSVAAPLAALTDATKRIQDGDLSINLPIARSDELGTLASSFNAMARAVADREEAQRLLLAEQVEAEQNVRSLSEILAAKYEAERERNEVLENLKRAVDALSTPVLTVWRGILALPLIGAVDERRAGMAMQKLLEEVHRTQCRYVIIDLTGVVDVDEATAAHLLRITAAVELLGVQCMLTGIRPAVARSMAALGTSLFTMTTKQTLEQAIRTAMQDEKKSKTPRVR